MFGIKQKSKYDLSVSGPEEEKVESSPDPVAAPAVAETSDPGEESPASILKRVMEGQQKMLEAVDEIRSRVQSIEDENLKAIATKERDIKMGSGTEDGFDDESEVVAAARFILQNGRGGKDFKIEMKKHSPLAFVLEIVAPPTLRMDPTDKHVKVIPYAEGVDGVKAYAEIVKKFLIGKATQQGIPYMA